MDDERLTVGQVAQRLNMSPSTWRSYVARSQAPAADGAHDLRTPWWYASTVDAWKAARPGRGRRSA